MVYTGLIKKWDRGMPCLIEHWQLYIQPIRYIGCPVVRNESDMRGVRWLPAGQNPVHGCVLYPKARAAGTWLWINPKAGLNRHDPGQLTMILPSSHSPLGRGPRNEGGPRRTRRRWNSYDACMLQAGGLAALSRYPSGQASGSSVK